MSAAQHTPGPAREWHVFVHHPEAGYIGSVMESNEELARCAALGKFGEEGERKDRGDLTRNAIYEDDDFDVRAVR